MDGAPVLLARTGAVARVTLNRPGARNALDLPMCLALRAAFEALDADPEVRAVLLDAAGPVFCAGADLKERQGKDEAWVRSRRLAAFAAGTLKMAALDGDVAEGKVEAGQSAGLVDDLVPAGELVRRIAQEYRDAAAGLPRA